MNETNQPAPTVKRSARWVSVLRVAFAIFALGFVVHSIDFRDYLVKGEAKFPILRQTPADYVVRTESGTPDSVSRLDTSYQFRRGAISLVRTARITPALIGLAVFAAVPIILAFRWQMLLRVQDVHLSFWKVTQLTYAGNLMNFFMIGTTGGDLVKAYWVGKFSPKRTEGFVSVFVDRFIGLVMLIMVAAVMVVLMWQDHQVARLAKQVGILVIVSAVAVVFLFSQRLRNLVRFNRWKHRIPLARFVDRIDQALLAYRRSTGTLAKAAGATVILQFLSSTASYFLGDALHIQAGIWYYWLYVPLAFLIGSIPLSLFWGLGLLEMAYIVFFKGSGFATVTQAAMLAMAVRLLQLAWSLPGALVLAKGIDKEDHGASEQN